MNKSRALRSRILLMGLTCLSSAVAARGQMGMGMRPPDIQGIFHPVVGSGASYDMTDSKQMKRSIEITVVGKEAVNGKDSYWLEVGMPDERRGGMMYVKTLMSADQNNVVTERIIVQSPGQPQPLELSTNMLALFGGNDPRAADIRGKADQLGTETITVPAGSFECSHYRMKDRTGDFWLNAKVVPWGMVKVTAKDSSMVLTKQINDAKDHITGTPIKFDPSQRTRQPQQHPN